MDPIAPEKGLEALEFAVRSGRRGRDGNAGAVPTPALPSGEGDPSPFRKEAAALDEGAVRVRKTHTSIRRASRPDAAVSLATARRLRNNATPQERKLWRQLRLLRPAGLHFRRQVPIGAFVVDFSCLKQRLVVEIDGGQHGQAGHEARDRARDAELARMGFRVRRFWNAEIDGNFDGVVETILAAAGGSACDRVAGCVTDMPAPSPPLPLPSGEGEARTEGCIP